jgi:hypothetical protein
MVARLIFSHNGDSMSSFLGIFSGADTSGVRFLNSERTVGVTPIGGFVVKLTNKTGSTSVKGTLIETGTSLAESFHIADTNSDHSVGVVYENGVSDGQSTWVVLNGTAEVLLKDGEASVVGYWVKVSDTAGRVDMSVNTPGSAVEHWREIGHSIESQSSGTNVLTKIVLHFN